MAINANFLSFIAGGAEQYTKQTGELKKELRENKRRQRDWLATYGTKALNESKQKQESVQSALDDLKARGLDTPDAIQLLQKHGVGSVLELHKYVKEYEVANNTNVDADLMNKLWKAAEDFTTTETTFEAAVAKVFGTSAGASTAPVIQEAEDRNFFEQLKYNMGERYDDELEDFLTDASEGIGGKSIRELRAMSASSPSMLGTDGSATFDRSQLKGSDSTPSDRNQWNIARSDIVLNAVTGLTEKERRAITQDLDGENASTRNTQNQFSLLKLKHSEALAEATRKYVEGGIDLSNNPAAWSAYGGQNALNDILNPPPPPEPLTPKELAEKLKKKEEQLEQDLIDNNLTGENRPDEVLTDAEGEVYFESHEQNFVIVDGVLVPRHESIEYDPKKAPKPPVVKNPVKPVKSRPAYSRGVGGNKDYKEWNEKYEGKYDPRTGTAIIVEKRPTVAPIPRPKQRQQTLESAQASWDRKYKDTHDAETGYPLGYVLNSSGS